jgi:hypothetical protein
MRYFYLGLSQLCRSRAGTLRRSSPN